MRKMNRSELLFYYDISNGNPNGDAYENKPRIDDETGINLVTDVRLKRTIRDYIYNYKGKEIFVRDSLKKNGKLKKAGERAKDFKDEKQILEDCIDLRLFGALIPKKMTLTGPVQFKMGKSLHKVEVKHIKGTGGFASTGEESQKTFREEYILPYSLIGFYGIINELAAKESKLTEEDIKILLEAMWNGTKNLITRSKFGQVPRMLLQIEYKEDYFFIGELDNRVKLNYETEENDEYDLVKEDKELRKIEQLKLDCHELIEVLEKNKNKIKQINYKIDNYLKFEDDLLPKLKELGIKIEEIKV